MTRKGRIAKVIAVAALALGAPLGSVDTTATADTKVPVKRVIEGTASWYGPKFHGKQTASGERFYQDGLTAAHKRLPFGTLIRVTNLENDKRVSVRVNDRGPFAKNRVLDLSKGAAEMLGMLDDGTVPVKIEVLERDL